MEQAAASQTLRSEEPINGAAADLGWFATAATPRFAIPILLVTGAILYLLNLGGYPLYTKGEPREAVTIFDIVHGGGWILPMRAGVELPSKPLMMHWLAALLSLAVGDVNEWTVRLPSALLAIAGIVVCYLYTRRMFDEKSAMLSALMLGTSVQYLQAGTGARVDMTLTFFIEVAFFEFISIAEHLSRRWIVLYLALSAAVLSKGPVGLALPAACAMVWIAIERRWDVLRDLRLAPGALIVAVLAGGWYAAAALTGGLDFVHKQIVAENLTRFLGGADFHQGHEHPFYYVELALLAGFMPWTVMLPAPALRLTKASAPLGQRLRYLVVWFLTVLVFFNLARSKRGVYLLALYPALAVIVAVSIRDALLHREENPRWVSAVAVIAGLVMVLAGLAGAGVLAAMIIDPAGLSPYFARMGITAPGFVAALARAISGHPIAAFAIPLLIGGLGIGLIGSRPRVEAAVSLIAAGVGCVALAANLFVVPAIADTLALKDFTAQAMRIVDGDRVAYLEGLNYDVAFYSGRTIPIVRFSAPDTPEYLICWRELYEQMDSAHRAGWTVTLASGPTELDGSGAMVLLTRRRN
jgi:4-amino-4-deoxy-L-arabinose transferase-like glycosyltransferase